VALKARIGASAVGATTDMRQNRLDGNLSPIGDFRDFRECRLDAVVAPKSTLIQ
jgi:hypothetical protein